MSKPISLQEIASQLSRSLDSAAFNVDAAKKAFFEMSTRGVKTGGDVDPVQLMNALARILEDIVEVTELLTGKRDPMPSVDWDRELNAAIERAKRTGER